MKGRRALDPEESAFSRLIASKRRTAPKHQGHSKGARLPADPALPSNLGRWDALKTAAVRGSGDPGIQDRPPEVRVVEAGSTWARMRKTSAHRKEVRNLGEKETQQLAQCWAHGIYALRCSRSSPCSTCVESTPGKDGCAALWDGRPPRTRSLGTAGTLPLLSCISRGAGCQGL